MPTAAACWGEDLLHWFVARSKPDGLLSTWDISSSLRLLLSVNNRLLHALVIVLFLNVIFAVLHWVV